MAQDAQPAQPDSGGRKSNAQQIQIILAVIGLISALGVAYFTYLQNTTPIPPSDRPIPEPAIDTPTSLPLPPSDTPTAPATSTPTFTSIPARILYPPNFSGKLAIPVRFGYQYKVYITGLDGAGINGPNPIALDGRQRMFGVMESIFWSRARLIILTGCI